MIPNKYNNYNYEKDVYKQQPIKENEFFAKEIQN